MEFELAKKPRVRLFNCQVDPLTMAESLNLIDSIIVSGKVTQHCVINVAKLVMMQHDPELLRIVNSCALINADGQGIVWGARMLGLNIPERVAGIDLFQNLVKLANQKGYRLYFLGARDHVVKRVVDIYTAEFPALQIAGFRDGYFSEDEEASVIKEIRHARPDILFLAITSPKKEYFLNKYLTAMEVPFVMGVGGSFDVVSGEIFRAPKWMQNAGLEWFFRFLNEPRRLFRRYFGTNSIYFWMILKALIFGRKKYGCS